ncbi:MAG: bifunctional 4-hydroxy-2-oxoglutarate aldolase/2-dehydro-3-deoxy-phosphogluconate aldolase [Sedimentisphaerales bacterium]|nr:bifunctional 4-hydroxy-2-oxoglutarate aldolase/2-dehydro-3-deoxy-phosphogluconate aldolase [Sedimentisphaerales bacterium]
MTNPFSWNLFNELPVVGILRGYNLDEVENIVIHSAEGGLRNIEITMNTDHAPSLISLACKIAGSGMNVGAGTVCSLDDLNTALAAGARFIVTPVVNPEVIRACNEHHIPVFPGAFTPTEIFHAWNLGADMVKLFPANRFGPSYIKEIKGPFDKVKLMPTGGVNVENLKEYHDCGADAFGVGSPLFHKDRVARKDWPWVRQQAARFVEAYKKARNP